MNGFKRESYLVTAALVLFTLLIMNLYITLHTLQAAGESQGYVQFNTGITLADNLTAFKGKSVTVALSSGQTMTGIMKEVQNNLLHLEKISQKEFYDAIIRIDTVSAIEARVR